MAVRTAGPSTISIHAPHEGERPARSKSCASVRDFNPRSPRGGATISKPYIVDADQIFQSTLPTRGSDKLGGQKIQLELWISIHAPHEGERRRGEKIKLCCNIFQSTLPTRGSDWACWPTR